MGEVITIESRLRNVSNGRKYATNIINNQVLNKDFRNTDLEEILQFHPDRIEKGVSNIDYLVIRKEAPYYKKALHLKSHNNDSEGDISYVISIQSMFSIFDQHKQDLKHRTEAFRNAIHNEYKIAFKFANTRDGRYGECSRCKKDVKACVDHFKTSFKYILDSFCLKHNIAVADTNIIWEENTVVIEDITIRNKWIDYHDSVVEYRILCNSCNISMGSYGYKSPKT